MSDATPRTVVIEDPSAPPQALLVRALDAAGFWTALDEARREASIPPDEMHILIKPDLDAFDVGSPTATAPALVEALIDLLHERGYPRVDVCGTSDSSLFWAENRDVGVLADLLGYRYETPGGHAYDVLDLGDDLAPAGFPAGGVLRGGELARPWQHAGFRVCFARNKTDERERYALCLNGLLGVLPLADKDYYYRQRVEPGEAIGDLLEVTPAHFAIVDATTSAHGSGGGRSPVAVRTDCVIASRSPLLADFVGALKMGLDPYASPLAAAVFRRLGLPTRYVVDGNLGTYPGWTNVEPAVAESTRRRDELPAASRLLTPWLQTLNPELFPLKRMIDAKVNPRMSAFFAEPDRNPTALWLLVLLNYSIGALAQWLDVCRLMTDKDSIRHVEVPLGFDPDTYDESDYVAIRGELDQLETLLADSPPAAEALRWREIDGATVFEFERRLPIPFDDFVDAVDVARTIGFMNDYIGGVVVPVARDDTGRVVRQAERNVYLPQPNYLALYQGKRIDVSKIEICDYRDDLHRMYWKTIGSENGSAVHDDGVVTFARTPAGTRVRIVGRQLFVLPPFWQAVNLELVPALKASLVTHAYKTFFERTCANFEALVEGRDVRLGRAWHTPFDSRETETTPAEQLERTVVRLGESLQKVVETRGRPSLDSSSDGTHVAVRVDEDGFRHFEGARTPSPVAAGRISPINAAALAIAETLAEFLGGLSSALARDAAAAQLRLPDAPS